MKIPSSFSVVLLMGACTSASPPAARGPDVPTIAADLARKTVAVYGEDHLCTGVWVGARSILTASHCIDIGKDAAYSVRSDHSLSGPKDTHPAHLVRADLDHDLALYTADGEVPSHLTAVLASSDPEVGTDLFFSGHVFGMFWTFRRGLVSGYRQVPAEHWTGPWMQVFAPIQLGDSGGGAFDGDGYLVGVAHSVAADMPSVAFFVKGSVVGLFLKGAVL